MNSFVNQSVPDLAPLLSRVMAQVRRSSARHAAMAAMFDHHWQQPGGLWRARLALESGLALGLSVPDAITVSASGELLHNASLLQDDWMDGDTTRRGQAAVWAKFGAPQAVLLGDYALTAGASELRRLTITSERKLLALSLYLRRAQDAIAGQTAELCLPEVALDRECYLRITRGKTGALLALPVELALAASGLWRRHARACRRGLFLAGQAYQLIGDLKDGTSVRDLNRATVLALCTAAANSWHTLPASLDQVLQRHIEVLREAALDLPSKLAA